jgi:hypothetical protein
VEDWGERNLSKRGWVTDDCDDKPYFGIVLQVSNTEVMSAMFDMRHIQGFWCRNLPGSG